MKRKEKQEARDWAECQMRRMKLESENVPDYSNSGPYGGDAIPDFEDLQMTEEEELGLGKRRRENWRGENGMQADDCQPTATTYKNRETGKLLTEEQMYQQYEHWKTLADYESYEDFISAVTDINGLYQIKEA